jgi:hypothetical protein
MCVFLFLPFPLISRLTNRLMSFQDEADLIRIRGYQVAVDLLR